MNRQYFSALAASLALLSAPVQAQDGPTPEHPNSGTPPPAVTGTIAPQAYDLPDPATLKMPALDFAVTPEVEADFDKYFYFHREDTPFEEAYADVRECDALASGSNIYMHADAGSIAAAQMQYGALAGGVGGVLGSVIADAIFGSAARRQQRRVNLRNCMGFKGYERYGLSADLWKEFNFEEGHGRKKEGERNEALELQALVASGPKPAAKELGL